MGVHERKCIDVPFTEKEMGIDEIDLDSRGDIFLKIYLLKTQNWSVLRDWIHSLKKRGKKSDKSYKREQKRLLDIYESIKKKGYVYPIVGQRDRPITVIKLQNGKYYNLNGADRMASILVCGIDRITVREVKETDFCCNRIFRISCKFNLEKGRFMESLPVDVKLWIKNFKKDRNG